MLQLEHSNRRVRWRLLHMWRSFGVRVILLEVKGVGVTVEGRNCQHEVGSRCTSLCKVLVLYPSSITCKRLVMVKIAHLFLLLAVVGSGFTWWSLVSVIWH